MSKILNSFIHINETQGNITINFSKAVIKIYTVFGAVVTVVLRSVQWIQLQQLHTNFLIHSKKYIWNVTRLVSCRLLQIIIYKHKIIFDTNWSLSLRDLWNKHRWHYTNTNGKHFFWKTELSITQSLSASNTICILGFHWVYKSVWWPWKLQ